MNADEDEFREFVDKVEGIIIDDMPIKSFSIKQNSLLQEQSSNEKVQEESKNLKIIEVECS